jgi:signal transduction histidine kinase
MELTLSLDDRATSAAAASHAAQELLEDSTSRLLRVRLFVKLLGANALVALLALVVTLAMQRSGADAGATAAALAGALVMGIVANITLTWIALRPIRDLERTVWRVWRGDPEARVAPSPVADPRLSDIGTTLNALLDRLDGDRLRMRELASEIIRAGDQERSRIGQELRESVAQSQAALIYQISAMIRDATTPATAAQLGELRVLAGQVLDQIDVLSHSVHPRVLNDLGLVAGLRRLATEVSSNRVAVQVRLVDLREEDTRGLGIETSSALFRIAQEAVQNAVRHSAATRVYIDVSGNDGAIALRITDDGRGFDVATAEKRRPGMGLFTMRQRASLVGATLQVDSAPGSGTSVRVTLPRNLALVATRSSAAPAGRTPSGGTPAAEGETGRAT